MTPVVYEFSNNPKAARRSRVLGGQLIETYDQIASASGGLDVKTEHAEIAPVMYGWWRYLTRTASGLYSLEAANTAGETAPQMRVLLEYVYAMAWLADHGPDALRALEDHDWEQRSKLIKALREHQWPFAGQLPDEPKPQHDFADEADEKRHRKILNEKKNFLDLTAAYGTEAMYDLYRFLCGYTHPSGTSASAYLHQDEDGKLYLRDLPEDKGNADVLWTTVVLLQAGHIVDPILTGAPLRQILNRVTRELGVPKEYLLSRPQPAP